MKKLIRTLIERLFKKNKKQAIGKEDSLPLHDLETINKDEINNLEVKGILNKPLMPSESEIGMKSSLESQSRKLEEVMKLRLLLNQVTNKKIETVKQEEFRVNEIRNMNRLFNKIIFKKIQMKQLEEIAEKEREKEEQLRLKQIREEQLRQKQQLEEEAEQARVKEEQLRLQRIKEEQLKQRQLEEERIKLEWLQLVKGEKLKQRQLEEEKAKHQAMFYDIEKIIIDEYKHLKTPLSILEDVNRKTALNNFDSQNYVGHRFFRDSVKFSQNKGKDEATYFPLKVYWTTYNDLHDGQKEWYFYWRRNALNGNLLVTDVSYIILFVYELLNFSFNTNAAFNVSMLVRLHDTYRETVPKVRGYIKLWLFDLLRELGEDVLAEKWKVTDKLNDLYEKLSDKDYTNLTLEDLYFLDLKITTKFGKENMEDIRKTFCWSLIELEKLDNNFIDKYFSSKTQKVNYGYYNRAVMYRDCPSVEYQKEIVTFLQQGRKDLTAIIRISENIVRLQKGYNRQLQVKENKLPKELWEVMLDRFKVVKSSKSNTASEEKLKIPQPPTVGSKIVMSPKTNIEFDINKIKAFKYETDSLIELIESNETTDETHFENDVLETSQNKLPINLSEYLDTEVDFEGFLSSLNTKEKEFIKLLSDNDEFLLKQAKKWALDNSYMLGVLLNSINEKSLEYIGENLVEQNEEYIVILEDYETLLKSRGG